jgi:hypothetical protein
MVVQALERQRKTLISAAEIALIFDLDMRGPPGVDVLPHLTPVCVGMLATQKTQANSSRPVIHFTVMICRSERT